MKSHCSRLHVPAALSSVLAVGAMNAQGLPFDFSNWGDAYQTQGILAPGENILGAAPGGGTALKSGTSFATPIVSGIVALLLSLQLQRGEQPNPHAVRDAILKSALPCNPVRRTTLVRKK
nr:S8 family serine peptidase [Nostoc sp. ChiQUE02]MDZ8230215.1 S8 family serine peptidase [Nostoc sp. ChiQUE02]